MRRWNSQGIAREDLLFYLQQEEFVRLAVIRSKCLLCCNGPVNKAGLCDGCFANLTDEEWQVARKWVEGTSC